MSRTDPQFKLRMPLALRAQVEQAAEQANRSLNAEIVTRLQASFTQAKPEVSANERLEPVPAPTTHRELRLLCLLVPSREGSTRSLPVHTMQPLPPRARLQGLIDRTLASEAGFHLRETQATAPTASVLERCLSKLHLRANGRVSVLGVTA
ncbi:Arc family DNA-binding protein [Ectopseudomonas mendocina]|nr:Arc family DNA-binding protein [Pseudomonas mendocina]